MNYNKLVKEIKKQGITKLPGLLSVVAEQCIKKIFLLKMEWKDLLKIL